MYTIAIDDPMAYLDGEIYAKENHSSLKELVNKYVASLAAKVRTTQKQNKVVLSQTEEFQKALAYVESLTAKGGRPVPAEENGLEALVEKKYKL